MKNKSMLKNVCFFTLIIMLSYTSKAEIVKKSFKIENFTSISVQTGIQVKVIINNNSDVAYAEGNDELMERLKVESNNGSLHIYYESEYGSRRNREYEDRQMNITVHTPHLTHIKTISAGNVEWDGVLKENNIEIKCASAGSVSGNIDAKQVNITISSAGKYEGEIHAEEAIFGISSAGFATVSGKIETLSVNAASASNFEGYNTISDNVSAKSSSCAKITLGETKKIEANAYSLASITYKQNGKKIKIIEKRKKDKAYNEEDEVSE